MTVEDRLEYAEQALGRDDCREAWAAAKAARRIAPRVTDVLKKVQRVRARCGNES